MPNVGGRRGLWLLAGDARLDFQICMPAQDAIPPTPVALLCAGDSTELDLWGEGAGSCEEDVPEGML